jgi:ABC-type proline/glycine betaine transport system ATPase subunit
MVPFIELGVGFNQDLDAFDNVVLNGVMMGLSPREARRRFDEVIEFAELEEFTEMKLKNYSSGMLVRLGFSLMTQVDADILLVDEVLAVGDAAFQQKCFDAFGRLHQEGRTIVLVTHDMVAVQSHCDRAILLESGQIVAEGHAAEVAHRYLELNFSQRRATVEAEDVSGAGEARMRFDTVAVVDEAGAPTPTLDSAQPLHLSASLEAEAEVRSPLFAFQVVNADGHPLFGITGVTLPDAGSVQAGQRIVVRAEFENRLAPGHYFIHAGVWQGAEMVTFRRNAADFVVVGSEPFLGYVNVDYSASAEIEDAR